MFKKLSGFTLALIGLTVFFTACKKDYETVATLDERNIEAYIAKNNIKAEKDPSGYYYQILNEGDGEAVVNSDSVYYSFNFQTVDGRSFAKNSDYMIGLSLLGYTDRFTLGGREIGLTAVRETMSKLRRGGNARVILPSSMAFGKNGNTTLNIGSNEIIIVDLKMYKEKHQHDIDDLEINLFVADNKLTVVKDPSRVQYIITQPGTGTVPIKKSTELVMNYTGRFLNGTVFQTNIDGSYTSSLEDQFVKGWGDVIPGKLTKGGKIRVLIPSDRAYGVPGSSDGTIPPNAVLDFDIEIVDVK
ncbi:hypothetical protein N180_18130 [Pedobacter antarcticus 4BY]|uniref:Peptidyl-prolyl cis-trans isomerase n=2 Tax=Pedobacter antarcticus TaxID=34086 RepID=A0A081PED9_9SPHI|nr:FKBP-type peptidyl-prolyl cis-trans isomerase [Pedobacter antarcticus]KEQ29062.1 hypothetical protein N180_18130 [Pedobacter antarcticus 4BY]SFF45117.1 FKBP-type peptidyl-prolyl cis-trans isomerase [Pedobacter antarcticus]